MKPTLMLVDIQQDYFPNGRMELVGAVEASLVAQRLLGVFRAHDLPVVHIQHISNRPGATFFLQNTNGIDLHANVAPLDAEVVIEKHYPNSFRETQLKKYLASKSVKELVICGMMSHMCIDATVRAAFDLGYVCTVAHDACATRGLSFDGIEISAAQVHGACMAALSGAYAKVVTADSIIAAL